MNNQNLKIKLKNGHYLCVELNHWSDSEPEEFVVFLADENDTILQDICIVRENKYRYLNPIELLIYADHNNEDYTDKINIWQYDFKEENL